MEWVFLDTSTHSFENLHTLHRFSTLKENNEVFIYARTNIYKYESLISRGDPETGIQNTEQ